MKRIILLTAVILALAAGATSTRAGGHCGGGWCGGGGWHGCGGGWHGGGCWGGGCGWHGGGWCGSGWTFGIGLNFGYPAYGYPAYAYAPATYAYVQPTYAYRPAYTVSATAVVASQPVKATTVPVYASRPAPQPAVAQQRVLAVRSATPALASTATGQVQPGGWVLDKNPYVYKPAPAPVRPATMVVSRRADSMPVYVVSR
jgi:hypothetical protein